MGTLNNNGIARNQRCLGCFFRQKRMKYLLCLAVLLSSYQLASSQYQPIYVETGGNKVVYLGIENRLTIAVPGIASDQLIVRCGSDTLRYQGGTQFAWYPKEPYPQKVQLIIEHSQTDQEWRRAIVLQHIPIRATVAMQEEGMVDVATMRLQKGIYSRTIGICSRCLTTDYTIHYLPKNGNSQHIRGKGSRFEGAIAALVERAAVGDRYFFTDIRVRCPGDRVARSAPSIFLTIK